MSAPTLSSHPGTSATERAHSRWGMNSEAADMDRLKRLITALRRLESEQTDESESPLDPADRDWDKWRRAEILQTGKKCNKCLGIKYVRSYKYAHHDDWVQCPRCTPVNENPIYPDADDDDGFDVPF